jgi:hypothetical protein
MPTIRRPRCAIFCAPVRKLTHTDRVTRASFSSEETGNQPGRILGEERTNRCEGREDPVVTTSPKGGYRPDFQYGNGDADRTEGIASALPKYRNAVHCGWRPARRGS